MNWKKKRAVIVLFVSLIVVLLQSGIAAAQYLIYADGPVSASAERFRPTYFSQLSEFHERLKEEKAAEALKHIVVRGDTLSKIATIYGIDLNELIRINNINNPNVILPGQVIALTDEKAGFDRTNNIGNSIHAMNTTSITHTLQRGETVWSIARDYQTDMSVILKANNITDPRNLEVGLVLTIPRGMKEANESSRVVAARNNVTAPRETMVLSRSGLSIPYTRVLTVSATAYCDGTAASGCPIDSRGHSVCTGAYNDGITASGRRAIAGDGTEDNPHLVAVDPRVFPLGTRLYIEGYGFAVAADTGGAIKGNRLDLLLKTHQMALNFGRRQLQIYQLQ